MTHVVDMMIILGGFVAIGLITVMLFARFDREANIFYAEVYFLCWPFALMYFIGYVVPRNIFRRLRR